MSRLARVDERKKEKKVRSPGICGMVVTLVAYTLVGYVIKCNVDLY